MNKKSIFFLSALGLSAASALTMSACRDYDVFNEETYEKLVDAKVYDDNFIARFGTPAENHEWGRFLLEPISYSGSEIATRATNNNVNTNRNQWCERETTGYKDQPYVLAKSFQVPGWPNFDGYYYANQGQNDLKYIEKEADIFSSAKLSYQPAGDVTEYEINYVSTWFRTHKNPGKIELHLTDFFIQNISQDNDQLEYNDFTDCGGNTIPQGLPGYPKTQSNHTEWWNGNNIEFANQAYNGSEKRTDVAANITKLAPNSNERLNYSMDYLHFMGMDGNPYTTTGFNPGNGWTHINNFNSGNTNFDPEDYSKNNFRQIMFVHSSGTEDFACRSSMANQDAWINSWVLVRLEWDEPGADDIVRHREGYYLAFDFHNKTNDTQIDCDGFYSNWIVKITPAYIKPNPPYTARVMCEDLGGSFDFDFNDVVFDVTYDNSTNNAVICIQAAGGTLPIMVGSGLSENYEVHKLLGHNDLIPINVDAAGGSSQVAIYRISANSLTVEDNGKTKLDFYKIPILVKHEEQGSYTDTNVNIPTMDEEQYGHVNNTSASKTPRKFATEVGVDWLKELKCIDDGYNKFKLWVKDPDYCYHLVGSNVETGAATEGVTLYWYDDRSNVNLLHNGPKSTVANGVDPTKKPVEWQKLDVISINNLHDDFVFRSAALEYITMKNYDPTWQNPVVKQLKSKQDNDPVTFAYIVKKPYSDFGMHGLILPIWLFEETRENQQVNVPYYVYPDGSKVEVTSTMLGKVASYREGVWQSSFNRSGTNGATVPSELETRQGVDADGKYTYVIKYGYTKKDLYVQPTGESERRYCDYMAFYVYENGYENAANGPVTKYETYVIF